MLHATFINNTFTSNPPAPPRARSLSIANLPPFLQRNLDPSPSMIFQKSQSSL